MPSGASAGGAPACGDARIVCRVSKKKPGRRGSTPQRRPVPHPRPSHHEAEDQGLLQSLRKALRSGEPLDFLAVVSGFLEVTDHRSRDPFARGERRTSLGELVESFIGTPYAETTAALMVIKALVSDDLSRRGSAVSS